MKRRAKLFRFHGAEYAVVSPGAPAAEDLAALSVAERELLSLALEGHSIAEIARLRDVSADAIDAELEPLLRKISTAVTH